MSTNQTAMPDEAASQIIVVVIETPTATYEEEFEIEADATEEQIEQAARDAFTNRCNYGWHRK